MPFLTLHPDERTSLRSALSVLLLVLLAFDAVSSESPDCAVLTQLYESTGGTSWHNAAGWRSASSTPDCCQWFGISCVLIDGVDRVTQLNLTGNGLVGEVGAELAQLSELVLVDLSINTLHGDLWPAWGSWSNVEAVLLGNNVFNGSSLPTEWSSWTKIRLFSIMNSGIRGSLPSEWSAWSMMSELSVAYNELSGSLPHEWATWSEMVLFSAMYNNIVGSLPSEWSTWVHMVEFNAAQCALSGKLPSEWGAWSKIATFEVFNNGLSGSLPSEWGRWSEVTIVSLSANALSGVLPTEWQNMDSLHNLYLWNNSLSGPLPSSWGTLQNLVLLEMYENNLEGQLPEAWSQWTELITFDADRNRIYGSLPSSYSSWRKVQTILVSSNALNGTLPEAWSALTELRILDVGVNNISGVLPDAWSGMTSMQGAGLENNELQGTLPASWSSWSNVTVVNFGHNKLRGPLPASWSRWSRVEQIDVTNNELSGTLPSSWRSMSTLSQLLMGVNQFEGSLPSVWSQMTRMSDFGASNNRLTGGLPSEWGAWKRMSALAVQSNRLSGELPASYGDWLFVKRVFLNENRFSGSIPSTYGEWAELEVVNLSDNNLTAGFPVQWTYSDTLQYVDVSYTHMYGSLNFSSSLMYLLRVTDTEFTEVDSSALSRTSIVSLDLQGLPIRYYPFQIGSACFLTVIDLRGTHIQLNISAGEFPMDVGSTPVVRLGDNPGVTGRIGDLVRLLDINLDSTNDPPSSHIDIGFSNTSIYGDLSEIDPAPWLGTNNEFPLSNLVTLRVANCYGLTGALPVSWMLWAYGKNQPLSLDVTGSVHLQVTPSAEDLPERCEELVSPGLPFDCSAPREAYTDRTYECAPLNWPVGISVVGLSAAYFHYRTCVCSPGYEGEVPNCTPESRTGLIVGLSVSFSIVTIVTSIFVIHHLIRWRNMTRDIQFARSLLSKYADLPSTTSGSGIMLNTILDQRSLLHDQSLSDSLVIAFSDVRIVRPVASGSQGRVSMAIWNRTVIAVKEYLSISENEKELLFSEAIVHSGLRHPNVVQLLGVCIDPPCTVTEWMEKGSLYGVLRGERLPLSEIVRIALDIARGMLYLHSKGIVHRDLKSMNVLLDGHGTAKVADFGTARQATQNATMTMCQGTAHWMAPEVFRGSAYSEKCDVYSYAIILWELVVGGIPYEGLTFTAHIEKVVTGGGRPAIPAGTQPLFLVELMEQCWDGEPSQRPSFDVVVQRLEAFASESGCFTPVVFT